MIHLKSLPRILFLLITTIHFGQKENIETLEMPDHLQDGTVWEFQKDVSNDFNYTFAPSNKKTKFGNGKWINFYQSK